MTSQNEKQCSMETEIRAEATYKRTTKEIGDGKLWADTQLPKVLGDEK
jgi:hypothetical protein